MLLRFALASLQSNVEHGCILTGRAAWSEIVAYGRLRESYTPPSGGGKTSLIDQEESVSCDAERCVVVKASPTSPFVLIQAQFLLELLIVTFDSPAQLHRF